MSEENKEVCPKCGNSDFSIARDMHSTRYCRCGNTWLPKLREENKTVFELNDRVTAFGVDGVVVSIDEDREDGFPIYVNFNGTLNLFTIDGKYAKWHLEPSLKLIEKAKKKVKKKVKKTIEAWACIHKDGSYTLCLSEAIAQNSYVSMEIVKLTGIYEVEE